MTAVHNFQSLKTGRPTVQRLQSPRLLGCSWTLFQCSDVDLGSAPDPPCATALGLTVFDPVGDFSAATKQSEHIYLADL